MSEPESEQERSQVAALRSTESLLVARRRAERELAARKDALERKAPELEQRPEEPVTTEALRLQLALASGNLGEWAWDAATDGVVLGARAATILGVSSTAPITRAQMIENVDAEDGPRVQLAMERAQAERTNCDVEFRVARPSGECSWVVLLGHGVYGDGGALDGMVGVLQDVTDRKRTDETRRHMAAIVESSDDAIISKTLEGVITSWNRGAERMFGYTASEVLGRSVTLLIPPNHIDEEPAILQRLRRGERIEHYETVRVRKDGRLLAVSLTVSPIRDASGTITGASKIARDITQRQQAEAALREERRILEILNATGASIGGQLDLGALAQAVTEAATQLSGARFGAFFHAQAGPTGGAFPLLALVGALPGEFEQLGLAGDTPLFQATFRGERPVRAADVTKDLSHGGMSLPQGLSVPQPPVRSYLAVPILARSGEVIGGLFLFHPEADVFTARTERLIVGVAAQAAVAMDNARLFEAAQQEIASRERAEAALRETDRRKDEFLATLAHELRNPLAPIRQAALISTTATATDAQKRWSHDVIARQVQHMGLLLDDLLDISRITRGTLDLRIEMTELAAVIGAAVEIARPAIDARRHRFSSDMPETPVHFAADPLRLAQVLANLLTNAAKYTDPEGQIGLRAVAAEDVITITVTDNGIGIPPASLGDVFAMFAQVRSSQHRSDDGLGIGLALAKGFVELHGGAIEAHSAGMGLGSEFTVRLPRRSVGGPTQAAGPPGPRAGPASALRVLIADDNRDAAESLAMLLQMDGHEVTVVHDGEQALAAFASAWPEVAILDIGMPGLNGYEVARRVRQGSLGRAVTLVAVTGWGQDTDKARALGAGFNHHFTKPLDPARLSELLQCLRR